MQYEYQYEPVLNLYFVLMDGKLRLVIGGQTQAS